MDFNIYNFESFTKLEELIGKKELSEKLSKGLKDYSGEINLFFIAEKDIKELNRKYLSKDRSTDVLAFESEIPEFWGDIYISPEYLGKNDRLYLEELLRMCIHGVLHLLGYKHEGYFTKESDEEIFVLQEQILKKILNN